MNCEEVRDELVAFAREELDPARMASIQEHLSACKECSRELEGARQGMALARIADEASVTELTHELIRTAIRERASDIQIEKRNGTPRVRFRIDGVLQPGPALAPEHHEPMVARIKAMAEMNVTEKRVPQDGRIRFTEGEKEYDLRVSVCPFVGGEGVVMRILDRTAVLVGLPRLGLTHATAMRAMLRQDPDIFMVSEFRDLETAELSALAAMTGHLVLGALHAPDATSALARLLQMGIVPFVVASTLVGIIGQRLVRTVCPECREPYPPAEKTLQTLGFPSGAGRPSFTRGAGCDRCAGSGYKGRTGLFEVLVLNGELARMIVAGAAEGDIRQTAVDQGALWPFLADARAKIAEGITTSEEVERVLLEVLVRPAAP
jgi:type II secretory ATPase GspE/PulE/Tfp pilus assembly ATPase PilB-like protein